MRNESISEELTRFLDRYSPPRSIAANTVAMQDELNELLRVLLNHAPKADYTDWTVNALRHLAGRMKTRSWPTVGELTDAVNAMQRGRQVAGGSDEAVEQRCVEAMAQWFAKFRNQMPGMGRDSRTRALIAQGTLADVREARFYGFSLSKDDNERAKELPPSRAEHEHHVGVLARIWGCGYGEAEARIERGYGRPVMPDASPVKRMPGVGQEAWT